MNPIGNFPFRSTGWKSFALRPISRIGRFCQKLITVSDAGTGWSAKRNNGFSGKIVCADERIDRPSGNAPPNRIADKNRIVFFPVIRCRVFKRNIPFAFIIMFNAYPAVAVCPIKVTACVRILRYDFKNICVYAFCYRFGNRLCTSGCRIENNKYFSSGSGIRLFGIGIFRSTCRSSACLVRICLICVGIAWYRIASACGER